MKKQNRSPPERFKIGADVRFIPCSETYGSGEKIGTIVTVAWADTLGYMYDIFSAEDNALHENVLEVEIILLEPPLRHSRIEGWFILALPGVCDTDNQLERAFASMCSHRPIALYGMANDSPTLDSTPGYGHRIVTSPIRAIEAGRICTEDGIYALGKMSDRYRTWCGKKESQEDRLLRHICETCGKEELLTSEEGFDHGWDYPPRVGAIGGISPRTCGCCGVETTLWWALLVMKMPVTELSDRHQQTLFRILSEPESILP